MHMETTGTVPTHQYSNGHLVTVTLIVGTTNLRGLYLPGHSHATVISLVDNTMIPWIHLSKVRVRS